MSRSTPKGNSGSRFIDAKIPIADVLHQYGIELKRGDFFLCPAHGDTGGQGTKPGNAHIVSGEPLKWTCFTCGAGGDSTDLIGHITNRDAVDIVSEGRSSRPNRVKAKQPPKPKIDYTTNHGHGTFDECFQQSLAYHVSEHEASPTKFVVYDYTPTFKRVRFIHRDTGAKIGPKPFEVHNNGKWYPFQNDIDKDRLLPLYGGDRLADIGPLVSQVIVEGEKCADIINALTSEAFPFVAVASANGGTSATKTDWSQLRGDRRIIIWPDADETGGKFRDTVARIILSSGRWNNVSLVTGEAVDDLLDGLGESSPEIAILGHLDDNSSHVRSSTMAARLNGGTAEADVVDEKVEFLLETPGGDSLFPLGKLTSLSGDGGSGKSLFLKHLSASVASGKDFFHYAVNPEMSGGIVCYLSQDEGGDGPRIEIKKIGCDRMERVWAPGTTGVSTMSDIRDQITRFMSLLPGERLALVVVDTGDDYLTDGGQGNNDGSVKADLNKLRELAESTGAAVVYIKHFSKAKCRFKDRIMGSAAWSNKPRQAIVIVRPPGDRDAMIGIAKSNVGRFDVAIGYMQLHRRGEGVLPGLTVTPTNDEYIAIEARIIEDETGGGRQSSIKTWPNDQIITWIIRTIRDSENGEISGLDLDERSRAANIPMDRFKEVRKSLKANKQVAHSHPKHGSIKWYIPEPDEVQKDV